MLMHRWFVADLTGSRLCKYSRYPNCVRRPSKHPNKPSKTVVDNISAYGSNLFQRALAQLLTQPHIIAIATRRFGPTGYMAM